MELSIKESLGLKDLLNCHLILYLFIVCWVLISNSIDYVPNKLDSGFKVLSFDLLKNF